MVFAWIRAPLSAAGCGAGCRSGLQNFVYLMFAKMLTCIRLEFEEVHHCKAVELAQLHVWLYDSQFLRSLECQTQHVISRPNMYNMCSTVTS